MSEYVTFLVIGVTVGTVYGLSAMGLVLTYKTTGVFNFGHGAIGAGAAVIFYKLRDDGGLPPWIAAFLAIVIFGIVVGAAFEPIARRLAQVSTTYKVVATVGLIVAVQALVQLIYGVVPMSVSPALSQKRAFTLSGVQVTYEQVLVTVFGVVSAIALYAFFRATRTGRAMRAVVDNPELLDMTGVSPTKVRRTAWMIGCGFAAVSGVLLASQQQQLDVTLLSLLVVQALGAAAIGAFTNLPMSFAGGIIVGVVQALISKEASSNVSLQGLDTNAPFIILFLLLLLIPKKRLVELGQTVKARSSVREPLPVQFRSSAAVVVLAGACVVPFVVEEKLVTWNVALSQVLLFLSLGLLVRTSGQISLCQMGFFAIGAAAFGHALGSGTPWLMAVLWAGAVAIPVGALIAIPAIRLSGLYLALATLGFGVLLANYFYPRSYFFGSRVGLQTGRPGWFESDKAYYFLLLGIAIAGIVLVALIERARLGRLLRGMADSPVGLTTLGLSANVTLVLVFCLSASMAAMSGALNASVFGGITQDSYSYVYSLIFLSVLVISGTSTIVAAIVAPLLSVVAPVYIDNPDAALYLQLGYGVAAIATAMLAEGGGSALLGQLTRNRGPEGAAPARSLRRFGDATPNLTGSRLQEVRSHANA
ncbi:MULTISPECIES: ABC transporter permease subunit [Sporichthya]|uniref:ABC transporter permease n=1 Tax=Sporichthya brevicatena TaxID=171442 RepID=A0ABP3RHN2_9ACTN|nr:ABC transporter permease [Sporichthya polymorpha]